jgi:2-polyprenyl-3-methyl-5-hydroxy-6-metoxy-1,4-benzoquinol methylase
MGMQADLTKLELSESIANDYRVYAESVRHEMLQFIPDSARSILDVGCSIGNFGALLKLERGAEVWGVEPDRAAAELASDRLDRVICSRFDSNLNTDGKKFDCIVFNDVLEHMVDPASALEVAPAYLNPDGIVVASIPNVRYFGNIWLLLVHKSWKYQDTGILDRTHLRFFTKKSIESLFDDAGFKIHRLVGINSLHICDPYFRPKFTILNILTLGRIADMEWMQFAVVANPLPVRPGSA